MTRPRASASSITCTQLVTRFDRNGEREIGLALLRRVRAGIRRDMRSAGARGSMIWRLTRTPSGITMTALWDPRRDRMIDLGQPVRRDRQERRSRAAAAGIQNRRRMGSLSVPNRVVVAA